MEFLGKVKINSHTITIRPRYNETDQGEVVHHSVYPVYFELGRTELLRANGLVYKDLEANGVFFVVAELNIRYRRPASYDEELLLDTVCSEVTPGKVKHIYKLKRKNDGVLLTEGWSTLVCVDKDGKIRRMPSFMYPE